MDLTVTWTTNSYSNVNPCPNPNLISVKDDILRVYKMSSDEKINSLITTYIKSLQSWRFRTRWDGLT